MFSSEVHSRTQDKRETRELSGLQVHVTRSTQVMARALPSNLKWRPISSQRSKSLGSDTLRRSTGPAVPTIVRSKSFDGSYVSQPVANAAPLQPVNVQPGIGDEQRARPQTTSLHDAASSVDENSDGREIETPATQVLFSDEGEEWNEVPAESERSPGDVDLEPPLSVLEVYEATVHWRKRFFDIPNNSFGKAFVSELAHLLHVFVDSGGTEPEKLYMYSFIVLPALLLQKPMDKCSCKEAGQRLRRRMDMWEKKELRRTVRRSVLAETTVFQTTIQKAEGRGQYSPKVWDQQV